MSHNNSFVEQLNPIFAQFKVWQTVRDVKDKLQKAMHVPTADQVDHTHMFLILTDSCCVCSAPVLQWAGVEECP
jgi:hypothetical protein